MFAKDLLVLCMLLLALVTYAKVHKATADVESSIVELDPESLETTLQHYSVFVMFLAPRCGHCQLLQPLWEQLAGMMHMVNEPKLIIATLDCLKHQSLCAGHKISGYPTLRFFKMGAHDSVIFWGQRNLPNIVDFINQQLNGNGEYVRKRNSRNARNATNNDRPGRVLELTDDTFYKHISRGKHFVKFFVPWCRYCRRLAPIFQALAESLLDEPAVALSKLDCTQFVTICQDFQVEGYPTLLWIENGKKIDCFTGDRDQTRLEQFVKEMLISSGSESAAVGSITSDGSRSKVLQLVGNDFYKSVVAQGVTFVNFYVPWCGHCQQLTPTWNELAEKVHTVDPDIIIANVDCTDPENKQLCAKQQIDAYPTLFAFKNGIRQEEYHGSHTLDELQKYINQFSGHDEF